MRLDYRMSIQLWKNCQAMLFDMDGVLIDSKQSVVAFWNTYAKKMNIQLTVADIEHFVLGCTADFTLGKLFPSIGEDGKKQFFEALKRYEADIKYCEIPGAVRFIKYVKSNDIPMAMVTSANKWKADLVKKQFHINLLFDVCVTGDEIQEGKPNPECYTVAMKRLGKNPETCIVFEDSISGIQSAVKAGAVCVGLGMDTPALMNAGASFTIVDFRDLKNVFSNRENDGKSKKF